MEAYNKELVGILADLVHIHRRQRNQPYMTDIDKRVLLTPTYCHGIAAYHGLLAFRV